MDVWHDHFFQVFEQASREAEYLFWEISQSFEEATTDLDQALSSIIEPIAEMLLEFDALLDDNDPFLMPSVPQAMEPSVCHGCQHYHGKVYGGNLLVCGMHPYGVETDCCPDWQG
jgi:hypothetical protein